MVIKMIKFKSYLDEGVVSSIAAVVFIKKLTTSFENWDEFKKGIIDKDGKILKGKLSIFNNIARKIKRLFHRFVPNKKYLLLLISMYLLKKEDITDPLEELVKDELDQYLTVEEKVKLIDILNEVSNTTKSVGAFSEKFFVGKNLDKKEAHKIGIKKITRDHSDYSYDPKTGIATFI